MKDKILNTKVSVYKPPIWFKKKVYDTRLVSIYEMIKSKEFQSITDKLRTISDDKENKKFKKENFTNVTFSGTFNQRQNDSLIKHSNMIGVDIDKVLNPQEVREKILNDPRCKKSLLLGFISPNGNGFKAIFYIDNTKHPQKIYYEALSIYLAELCQLESIKLDENCNKVCSTCFLPHDPDAYINPVLVSDSSNEINFFDIKDIIPKIEPENTDKAQPTTDPDLIQKERKRLSEMVRENIHEAKDGQKHSVLSKTSFTIGGHIPLGIFSFEEAEKLLQDEISKKANVASLNDAFTTIKKGLENGIKKPFLPSTIKKNNQVTVEEANKHPMDQLVDFFQERNIKFNEITMYAEINSQEISEQAMNSLFYKVTVGGIKISRPLFDTIINSDEISKVNPLREFVERNQNRLPQGNIERLAKSLNTVQGFDYTYLFLRKWLLGMVASIYKGNFNVLLLCLIGAKNTGKTEFFRRLLPKELKKYFAQSKLDQGKDSEALMCQKWVILNDELDGISRREAKSFRNFISAEEYTFRPPYMRRNSTFDRLASVAGTSNDRGILTDAQHNRRIIPIEITSMNYDLYNSINKTDLIMEAYWAYHGGESWELNKEEIELLDAHTMDYEIASVEEELIQQELTIPDESNDLVEELTATEIKMLLERESGQRIFTVNLGKALSRLGFEKKVVKVPGTRRNKQVYRVLKIKLVDESSNNAADENKPSSNDVEYEV